MTLPTDQLERLAVDTIRTLSIDGVQQANSGHPGAPMGMAPMAYALWTRHLRHAPTDPAWPNRDRFVLSAGHASMLLYSLLHLTGYAVSPRRPRVLPPVGLDHARPPGVRARPRASRPRPARSARAWSTPSAWPSRSAAWPAEFNRPGHDIVDHRTYVICSDGDLQEGITAEASSLAGHLGLGKLIALYDDNRIQLDGPTAWAFTEDVRRALRRPTAGTPSASTTATTSRRSSAAIEAAKADEPAVDHRRPHPHRLRQPEQAGHPEGARRPPWPGRGPPHQGGLRLGPGQDVLRARRGRRAVPPRRAPRAGPRSPTGTRALDAYAAAFPAEAAELRRRVAGRLPDGWDAGLTVYETGTEVATRNASQDLIQSLAGPRSGAVRRLRGPVGVQPHGRQGARATTTSRPAHAGRNLRFGVREHAMGGIVNGIAYHGGFLPYGATFLTFSDYMRGSVRLAALSGLHVIYVWTHDSVGLGEDGPTHQPVEHYAALRAIPNLWFVRPGDANETAAAWALAVERPSIAGATSGPVALALTRQKLPTLPGTKELAREGVRRGGYVLREAAGGGARSSSWSARGPSCSCASRPPRSSRRTAIPTRVVSLPCWERFEAQDAGVPRQRPAAGRAEARDRRVGRLPGLGAVRGRRGRDHRPRPLRRERAGRDDLRGVRLHG